MKGDKLYRNEKAIFTNNSSEPSSIKCIGDYIVAGFDHCFKMLHRTTGKKSCLKNIDPKSKHSMPINFKLQDIVKLDGKHEVIMASTTEKGRYLFWLKDKRVVSSIPQKLLISDYSTGEGIPSEILEHRKPDRVVKFWELVIELEDGYEDEGLFDMDY